MANPQKQLFKILAESNLRINSINKLRDRQTSNVAQQHAQTVDALNDVRDHLQRVGIGVDGAAEQKYMQLLEDAHYLQDTHDLRRSPTTDERSLQKSAEPLPEQVQRLIHYGRMLIDIYRPGVLIKGASGDLDAVSSRLEKSGYSEAIAIAAELRKTNGFNA